MTDPEKGGGAAIQRERDGNPERKQDRGRGIIKSCDPQNGPKTVIVLKSGGDSGMRERLCPICSWSVGAVSRELVFHILTVSGLSWSTFLGPRVHPIFLAHFGYSQDPTVFLVHTLNSRDLTFDSTPA